MHVDFFLLNLFASLAFSVWFIIGCVAVYYILCVFFPSVRKLQRVFWVILFVIMVFLIIVAFNGTQPRVAITDESGTVVAPTGEVQNLRPKLQTDQERLDYTREQFDQNKID